METTFMKNLTTFLFILCLSFKAFAQEEYSSSQIKKYKNGIFEVITLKLEDKTEYKDEFPHKLIPFQTRNDKYYSLGTAFLIDERTFVSAAHVFSIGQASLLSENYAVRDSDGNVFEITQVEKYSNYRDLIQFKVKQDTASYHKFSIAEQKGEEGDTVYAAGNALGEGVIFRKGTLTSYTYEPIDGKWKYIRFSAPASPGNSGGPLLNLEGQVVGIVTRKSESENLNYAFPIKEFDAFSTEQAEFVETQMGEFESTKSLMFGWEFSTDLPKDILKLREVAEQNYYARFSSGRQEFVDKYREDIFPQHKNVKKYLKKQSNDESLAIIDVNGNGEWALFTAGNEQEIKISDKQSLWFGSNDKMIGDYQFFMEKPESVSLASFIADKKGILDTFLKSVNWNRTIGETPVYITSYGEPEFEESYTDNFGRTWEMASWHDTYADRGLMIYCLPMPQGVVCDFINANAGWLEVQKGGYKDNLHRIMLSYTAKLDEWVEFLQLPKKLVPSFLQDAKLTFKERAVEYKLGEFNGILQDLALTKESSLYVKVEIDPQDINGLLVGYFSFRPNINEDSRYAISRFYDRQSDASESYADSWRKFTAQKSPYDFSVVDEGEVISKKMNLSAHGKAPKGNVDGEKGIGYLATCDIESTKGHMELDVACESFINGLNKL
jgi:hypothetical protein